MLDIRSTELNLIPIFVAIYEERSLSRAATRMEISQPAVSKALKRLREIYDDPLFHRKVAGMEPTSFAIDIYPAMAAALKNFSSTLSTSRAFNPRTSQRVFSIACITLVSARLIPALLCKIREQAPGIALEVHPLFTEDMESDLRMQRYDLIIDMTQSGRSMLKSEVLYAEQVKVVCASNHPRLGSDLTVEAYFTEEHVALAQWQVRGSMITAEHLPQMANRNIVVRVPSAMEMLPIIARSEIIGVLPHSTIETFAGIYDVRVLPFPFDESVFSLSAIWHPSRTAEAGHRWLRQQLFEVVSELGLTPQSISPSGHHAPGAAPCQPSSPTGWQNRAGSSRKARPRRSNCPLAPTYGRGGSCSAGRCSGYLAGCGGRRSLQRHRPQTPPHCRSCRRSPARWAFSAPPDRRGSWRCRYTRPPRQSDRSRCNDNPD